MRSTLRSPRAWLAVVAVTLFVSTLVPAAAGAGAGAIPPAWGKPVAFDFGDHEYGHALYSMSCASASLCVGGDEAGNVITSTAPIGGPGAWAATSLGNKGGWITSTSCAPSASLCVAVLGHGDQIFTSADPTGGASAWTETDGLVDSTNNTSDRLTGISCPSPSLCVASDFYGSVLYSTDPTGGTAAWTRVSINPGYELQGISCPSISFCAAVDASGRVLASTNPTGDATTWKPTTVTSYPDGLLQISCSSTSLCVALDTAGDVIYSTDPTDASPTWTTTQVDSAQLETISCPSDTECVIGDSAGNVITSTDPTGDASAWHSADVNGSLAISAVSCPSTALCVATSDNGVVITSSDPTGGAAKWFPTLADPYVVNESNLPDGVSCPSTALCVAVDSYGNVVASTDPIGGAPTWTKSNVDAYGVTGISCPSSSLCVAVDQNGNVLTSTDPAGGTPAWTTTNIDAGHALSAVSCAPTFCVAVDDVGHALTSTDPTGGALTWTSTDIDGSEPLTAISCASTSLCVAGDDVENLIASTDPTVVAPTWTPHNLGNTFPVDSVSCPTSSFCMTAADGVGYASTDPSGGAWTAVTGVTMVSCPSTSLCVGGDSYGDIVSSTDPTDPSQWNGPFTAGAGSFSISCPSNGMCVAVYRDGHVLFGLTPPTVSLGPVESIGPTSATLTGTVNPDGFDVTDCYFAWGVGTLGGVPYEVPCNVSPGSGTSPVTVTATLTGLSPNTTYEYALFTMNATGVIVGSEFPHFTTTSGLTPPPPPPPPQPTPPPDQMLTILRYGAGSGTVTSSPAGLACGATCSHAYAWNTHVTLTEKPASGSTFNGWSGACSGTGTSCTVTMDQARWVDVVFAHTAVCVVPKLKGKKLAAARTALRKHHCRVGKITKVASPARSKGRVIAEKPKPGRHLREGAKVALKVGK